MDWNAQIRRHADIIAGFAAWFIVGWFAPPEWGIVGLAAGVAAYFATQKWLPESRG